MDERMKERDKLDRLRDAKLLVEAIRCVHPTSDRHAFLRRIQRSYRKFGSLTPSMREALTPSSSGL